MRPSPSGGSATAEPDTSRDCRGDHGLTTLEWLLITAAVGALAALAVVVVQREVQDTAQRVSNADARVTAAIHSAFEVENDAKAATADDHASWSGWEDTHRERCSLLAVLYSDAGVEVVHNNFNRATRGTDFDAAAARYAAAGDEQPATAAKAQVQCEVQ